jgi:hypothetical protein
MLIQSTNVSESLSHARALIYKNKNKKTLLLGWGCHSVV